VLAGELRDEMFAAKLADVVRGVADPIYQDPVAFFANTHPARGLKSLLSEALGRATGKRPSSPPIIRLETAFGGGKTHSLIALYHL
ncbi:MAG: ATPase, partial [Thermoleophilia bacterium]